MSANFGLPSDVVRNLHKPSNLGTITFVVYACFLYSLSAYLIYYVISTEINWIIKAIILVPLNYLSLCGLRLMGNLGHDGTHFTLHKNKVISVLIGCFFSSSIIGFTEMGFSSVHWYHHKYTNQVLDPDVIHYRKFKREKGLLKRLLLAFPSRIPVYYMNTIKMSLGVPLERTNPLPLSSQKIRLLSMANLLFSVLWISIYLIITLINFPLGLFSFILPNLLALIANSFTVFIQHSGTETGRLQSSRSLTSSITTILYFGGNYHLEHHLFPAIPMYRLPKVHHLLVENGTYQNNKVYLENNGKGELVHGFGDYPMG